MLVLSRQRDETIMIGDEIEITVVDIRGDKVRLGINAPRTIQVHRKEVYEAIRRENAEAAQIDIDDLSQAEETLRQRNGHPKSNGRSRLKQSP
jgi:carbon storage regulator